MLSLALWNNSPTAASIAKSMTFLMMGEMVCTDPLLEGCILWSPELVPDLVVFIDRKKCPTN